MKCRIVVDGDYIQSSEYVFEYKDEEDFELKSAMCIDDYVESEFDPSVFDDDYDEDEFVASCKIIEREEL